MHVVRELVDWATHGGDFIFQGVPLDMTHVACSRQTVHHLRKWEVTCLNRVA